MAEAKPSPLRRAERDQCGRLFVQLQRSEFTEFWDGIYIADSRLWPWRITDVDAGRAYVERVEGWPAVALRALFSVMWCWAWLTGEVSRG